MRRNDGMTERTEGRNNGMTDKANTKCPLAISWWGHKNTNVVENVEYFLSSFLKLTSAVAEKSMMPIRGLDGHLCFQIVPKTQTWLWTLSTAYCQVLLKFKTAWTSHSRSKKCFSQAEDMLPDRPKNINLVQDVGCLLSVNFRQIMFSSCRDIKNVSANQMPWGHLCFQINPQKTQTL